LPTAKQYLQQFQGRKLPENITANLLTKLPHKVRGTSSGNICLPTDLFTPPGQKKARYTERAESIFLEENRGDKCIMLHRGISIQLIVGMIEIRKTDN
jgi:hypothetical protein